LFQLAGNRCLNLSLEIRIKFLCNLVHKIFERLEI
jgi:hypothetical protein